MKNNNVTDAEKELFYCMMGTGGGFTTKLFHTILAADTVNTFKLALAFPEEVSVALRYKNESNYWQNLQKKMKHED